MIFFVCVYPDYVSRTFDKRYHFNIGCNVFFNVINYLQVDRRTNTNMILLLLLIISLLFCLKK